MYYLIYQTGTDGDTAIRRGTIEELKKFVKSQQILLEECIIMKEMVKDLGNKRWPKVKD